MFFKSDNDSYFQLLYQKCFKLDVYLSSVYVKPLIIVFVPNLFNECFK